MSISREIDRIGIYMMMIDVKVIYTTEYKKRQKSTNGQNETFHMITMRMNFYSLSIAHLEYYNFNNDIHILAFFDTSVPQLHNNRHAHSTHTYMMILLMQI